MERVFQCAACQIWSDTAWFPKEFVKANAFPPGTSRIPVATLDKYDGPVFCSEACRNGE